MLTQPFFTTPQRSIASIAVGALLLLLRCTINLTSGARDRALATPDHYVPAMNTSFHTTRDTLTDTHMSSFDAYQLHAGCSSPFFTCSCDQGGSPPPEHATNHGFIGHLRRLSGDRLLAVLLTGSSVIANTVPSLSMLSKLARHGTFRSQQVPMHHPFAR